MDALKKPGFRSHHPIEAIAYLVSVDSYIITNTKYPILDRHPLVLI